MYDNFHLELCKNYNEKIIIKNESIFLNTLILGNKSTGKSSKILKNLAYQTILDKNVGGAFFVTSKDLSYDLYALAKHHKRRVLFVNPEINSDVEDLINSNNIVTEGSLKYSFEKFIFNNYIIIVDINIINTKDNGINFAKLLLNNLEKSMCNTDATLSKPFLLYIDDAFNYIDSLKQIIYYGNEYNIATTLFFQNRGQFKTEKEDYTNLIDSNVHNLILTNKINYSDYKYYKEIINIDNFNNSSKRDTIFYKITDNDNNILIGQGNIEYNCNLNDIINDKSYSMKRSLKRKKYKSRKNDLDNNKTDNLPSNINSIDINNTSNSIEDKSDIAIKRDDYTTFNPNIDDNLYIETDDTYSSSNVDWDDDYF